MVLLIGNFPPDQQQSMQRFSEMMLRELRALGIAAELTRPEAYSACLVPAQFVFLRKWAGYIDKFIIFPRRSMRNIFQTFLLSSPVTISSPSVEPSAKKQIVRLPGPAEFFNVGLSAVCAGPA